MRRRGADEAGDSLIEIVFALVIIGVVIGAFVASFSTGATASSSHRNNVTGDVVLRNYAEAAKTAARNCATSGTLRIVYPSGQRQPGLPAGYTVRSDPVTPMPCPAPTNVVPLTLTVKLPSGVERSLLVEVRTP
jgi:type II secretory pathway pseudopilin PulG